MTHHVHTLNGRKEFRADQAEEPEKVPAKGAAGRAATAKDDSKGRQQRATAKGDGEGWQRRATAKDDARASGRWKNSFCDGQRTKGRSELQFSSEALQGGRSPRRKIGRTKSVSNQLILSFSRVRLDQSRRRTVTDDAEAKAIEGRWKATDNVQRWRRQTTGGGQWTTGNGRQRQRTTRK